MSLEGGQFICYRHEFETGSVKEWDKHCYEKKHTLDIVQQCKNCKEWNYDHKYPYPERFVERSNSNKEEDRDFLVLKCQFCKG